MFFSLSQFVIVAIKETWIRKKGYKMYGQTRTRKSITHQKKKSSTESQVIELNLVVEILVGSHGRTKADFEFSIGKTGIRHARQVLDVSMPISRNFLTNLW